LRTTTLDVFGSFHLHDSLAIGGSKEENATKRTVSEIGFERRELIAMSALARSPEC
jgi:hypothetical protein